MKFHLFSSLLLLAAPALASNVLEANTKTFDKLIGSTPSFVEFYATWCGHCKNLAPTYEQLADAFVPHKGKVNVVKIDADGDGRDIGQKYGVTGFPTLKWFPNGVDSPPEDYNGARDLDALAAFITDKSGLRAAIKLPPPPATAQLDIDNFKDIALDESKSALVAFTAPWCGHCKNMKPTLEVVAKNFADESDCIVANFDADAAQNKPIASSYGVSSYPTIKFFPKGGDKAPIAYELGRSEADFTEFLNQHCGTQRAVGGGLNEIAGRVAALDSIASQIFVALPTSRADLLKQASEIGHDLGDGASYYLRVMEKLVNGTENFVEKEAKRLANILQKKTLAPRKLDEIKKKANILAAFVSEKSAEGVASASSIAAEATARVKAEL